MAYIFKLLKLNKATIGKHLKEKQTPSQISKPIAIAQFGKPKIFLSFQFVQEVSRVRNINLAKEIKLPN